MICADTNELLWQEYQLRYQVYCEEFGFEKKENFPAHVETDAYDNYAKHCLLIHKPSDRVIGCLRLIVKDTNRDSFLLPIEEHCNTIDSKKFDFSKLKRKRLGEYSRFTVLADFRRRKTDHYMPVDSYTSKANVMIHQERRMTYPIIPLSLCLVGLVMGAESKLDHGLAIMESGLAALLKRSSIHCKQIGGLMDYHGPRAPYEILLLKSILLLSEERKALTRAIANDLGGSFVESIDRIIAETKSSRMPITAV